MSKYESTIMHKGKELTIEINDIPSAATVVVTIKGRKKNYIGISAHKDEAIEDAIFEMEEDGVKRMKRTV